MGHSPIYVESGQSYRTDPGRPQRRALREGKILLTTLARGNYIGKRLTPGALPGIRIIGTLHAVSHQDWGTEWHRNEGIEICHLESGRMPFLVDRECHTLQCDDLSITRPWQLHRLGNPNITEGRLHFVVIDVGVRRPDQPWTWPTWAVLLKKDLDELTHILRHTPRPVCHGTREIRHCFQAIARLVESYDNENNASHLHVLLNELLVLLLGLLRQSRVPLDPALSGRRHTVELFLKDLAANPSGLDEAWTVETMARRCGLSPSTFLTYCKELTNLPPSLYVARCRVDFAAGLLRNNSAMTITEAAYAAGFSSSQYFATVFRRFYQCTPRAFRAGRGNRLED